MVLADRSALSQILDNLKFTFMGTFEAQKGKLGFFTDVIYLDVGDDKTASRALQIGNTQLPAGATADVGLDLKSWVWTLGGSYRTVSDSDLTLDVFGGTRLLDAQQKLNWTVAGNVGQIALPDRTGNREAKVQNWDVIAGVKGRARFGQSGRWFAPFYFDIGTGESDVTLQAMAGVGYTFGWGDVVGAWRYLDYNMKSSSPIADLSFNGPLIAAVFRW